MHGTAGLQMSAPPKPIRPSQHYRIDGFKGSTNFGPYYYVEKFQVPNTKKCKFFQEYLEVRNKSKKICEVNANLRGSCVENFIEL